MKRWLVGLLTWQLVSLAAAQTNPHGPADVIGGARRARDARDLEQAGERGTSTGTEENAAPTPSADPHAGLHEGQERPSIATERADASLPDGTLRVRVLDADGTPAASAEISIGVMAADGNRSSRGARTGADGVALVSGLAVGERQAYRVNVPYQGAKYSSNPFRLPPRGGYEVEIRRFKVTHDARLVVLYLGATSLELKDDRIKVVQEAELLNLGGETYVFPEAGTLVRLPKGFMAMQTQESMTDQHVVEAKGEGLRVHGSLPPGQATLLWGFDLPMADSEAHFTIDIPWIAFSYRVISDAPAGMTLQVEGMPEPIVHAEGGRRFLVTEIQRKIGESPFRRVQITLRGIPGPGPARFIAAGLALCALFAGIVLARRPRRISPLAVSDFELRKSELLARARELRVQREAGETGPQYHDEQMLLLTDELAALLFEEAELKRDRRHASR